MSKIKVNDITIRDLIKEAVSIPQGWKEEIYVENGRVIFSGMMTLNTHSGLDAYTPLPEYVADLEALDLDAFEGLHKRNDGTIELAMENDNDDYNDTPKIEGECYDLVQIIDFDDAVDIIENIITPDEEYEEIINKIQHPKAIFKDDAVRCERCGVEVWSDVDCDCGIDGDEHEGIEEAYEQKKQVEVEAYLNE